MVCVMYRPPHIGETETISTLANEISQFTEEAAGLVMVGDFNVHNQVWLRYSRGNSAEGKALERVCDRFGLKQLIREPTRLDNLLDLLITDMPNVEHTLLREIVVNDHKGIWFDVDIAVPLSVACNRWVWRWDAANWDAMARYLELVNWNIMDGLCVDVATVWLCGHINVVMKAYIPGSFKGARKKSHPWVTPEIKQAVMAKQRAVGFNSLRHAAKNVPTLF